MQIAAHCPELVSLRTSGDEIRDDPTEALVTNCHYLQILHLREKELSNLCRTMLYFCI